MTVFGKDYAGAYDALYDDKNYAAECDVLERVIGAYAEGPTKRVLDLGCGTGGHALVLCARGYDVVGVDRSEEMLALARAKANASSVTFRQGDIRSVDLGERFDVALMMFAVLGYLESDDDVAAALATARRHLRDNGLLVFDVWYEPAVLAIQPSERVKTVESQDRRIVRRSTGELDPARRVCEVRLVTVFEGPDGEQAAVEELHTMRYFSRRELESALSAARLELVAFAAFPDIDREPDETTWNVLLAARAV